MSIEESVYEGLARRVEALQAANVTLQGKIEELEKASQWIPVSERLPEGDDLWCLVYADGAMNCMGYSAPNWKRWSCKEDDPLFNIVGSEITHWMPLPKPPAIKGEQAA